MGLMNVSPVRDAADRFFPIGCVGMICRFRTMRRDDRSSLRDGAERSVTSDECSGLWMTYHLQEMPRNNLSSGQKRGACKSKGSYKRCGETSVEAIRGLRAMLRNDLDYRLCVMRFNDQSLLFDAAKIHIKCRGQSII
jgi:hypothetical protein